MTNPRAPAGYTVKQLASLSGVSVRALHHYDEIGLLKPAWVSDKGYRYYGREELLRLQQILFHRALGMSLREIKTTLDAPDFDRGRSLRDHREVLLRRAAQLQQLIGTIDETLAELAGGKPMSDQEIYKGFDTDAIDEWVISKYGAAARWGIGVRKEVTAGWSEEDWRKHASKRKEIFSAFAAVSAQGLAPDSEEAQAIAARLYESSTEAWPNRISRGGVLNMAEIYAENPEIRARLQHVADGLADYVAQTLRLFAIGPQLSQ